ncbi:MAG: hypothetical protein GWN61_00275 [candidate division Zixibacteria bacterium]|nr:hypothetical protein [candidate division Zixibacteria bacterium]NIR62245.1 hypothetical protein [candidate division Zixibacteria bacterium]NIS14796.1 hypothetical protein [candidate division Zixibacteria bacterium]NIS44480.1 hypothetical protein [candidate division Zixibacteria bacterium]NIU12495.1 hypothetical protein [candidate division Zixibacteria bacterium]
MCVTDSLIQLMRYLFIGILITTLLLSSASADFGLEVKLSGSVTNNLISDSSEIYDSYSTTSTSLRYYPFPQIELNLKSEYNYYSNLVGLGNFMGGAELTWIPTSQSSPLALYFNAGYDNRSYRESFSVYNTNIYNGMGSISYRLAKNARVRAGITYEQTEFDNSAGADKEILGFLVGTNFTFLGSNSLDIESGYSYADFISIDEASIMSWPQVIEEVDGDLKSFYISPRYSRPLGRKLGMNLTYTYLSFVDFEDPIVYSYSTGFLSPWASVWDGNSITLNLKSYHVPKMIITAGGGYWNKRLLRTLELPDRIVTRKDDYSRYYVGLSWPMPSRSGTYLEPSIQFDIINNTSIDRLYDYSTFSVVVGLTFRR